MASKAKMVSAHVRRRATEPPGSSTTPVRVRNPRARRSIAASRHTTRNVNTLFFLQNSVQRNQVSHRQPVLYVHKKSSPGPSAEFFEPQSTVFKSFKFYRCRDFRV